MSRSSQVEEEQEKALGRTCPWQVTKTVSSTNVHGLQSVCSTNVQGTHNVCSLNVQGTQYVCSANVQGTQSVCSASDQPKKHLETSGISVANLCRIVESSDRDSCCVREPKEKSGRGGGEVPYGLGVKKPWNYGIIDEKRGNTKETCEDSCASVNLTVSGMVTAFQEVKSEFKNAVKDAHCELVSTVSEVKNELSHVLTRSPEQCTVNTGQQISSSSVTDAEGNILLSNISKSSEDVDVSKAVERKCNNRGYISCDFENLTPSPKTQQGGGEPLSEGHKPHLPLESYDNAKAKQEFHYSAVHRPTTVMSMDVNRYSQESELTSFGIRHTKAGFVTTDSLELGENAVRVCNNPKVIEQIQNNNLIQVGSIIGQVKTTSVGDDHPLCVEGDRGRSSHLLTTTSIEEECGGRAQAVSAPSTPVPSASGSVRKVLRTQGCQGRRVSFPEDDTRLISSYLEPVNPWQQMAGVTVEEIAAAYKSSCERHGTQPLPAVLQQIKALPLVVGGRVECISLRGQRLEGGQCEGLEEIFRRVQFKILDLEGCSLEDDTAIPLFDMIEFYDSATQLNISCNSRIGCRGWQACARMLKRTPSVEYLDARNTNLNETNMPILGRALKLGARLHTLHLESCNLTGRPLIMLTAALKQNDTLAELYLAENRLGVNDCIQIGNLVRANSTLRVLDLRNNNVQDAGSGHVCEGIFEQQRQQQNEMESNGSADDKKKTTAKGLTSLILWNNHLTQQSARHLASLLSVSTTLEMLNLGRNNLTSEGILRLKESLLRNRSLLRLGLQAARIADEGAVALAEYTADNTVIQQIDLRENPIRVAGLMALAHSLRLNTTIIQMDLDSDPRTEPAVELAEQHQSLQKEIKEYCQRNLTQSHLKVSEGVAKCPENILPRIVSDVDRLSVNTAMRKVSLTCETSPNKVTHSETKCDTPIREEEKQKYVSPAPSPLPSPSPSPCVSPSPSPVPSPLKNRFRVFKVQESSRSISQLPMTNTSNQTSSVCSSAPVSQTGRSMSAGDLNVPIKQPFVRPNRFSIGGRFTVTRVTEISGSCSLPNNHVATTTISSSLDGASSPKIVISSPVRVERGFSIEETSGLTTKRNSFSLEEAGDMVTSTSGKCTDRYDNSLPETHPKTQEPCLLGHIVRLKSDSDSDDVFMETTNGNNNSGWSDAVSQKSGAFLRSGTNESGSTEKDNDSVSSSELTDSGFLDDSVCGGGRGGGSSSPSPNSHLPEGDRDSLLSSSVDSTSQEDSGLGPSISSSNSQGSLPSSSVPVLPPTPPLCSAQPPLHPIVAEPLKRAPLAAMENGSFDSDSEDSEVTTQSSDSTHSDEVRITTEQFAPRPAWGLKQESGEETHQGAETSSYLAPETPGSG